MNKKTILLVAIMALTVFLLPSAVSLFTGQHTWYSPAELDGKCNKCHQIIVDELQSSENGVHTSFQGRCSGCHTTGTINDTGAFWFSRAANRTKQGWHAATTISCVTCHSGVGTYNPAKYNATTGTWAAHSNSLLNPSEAHGAFYLASMSTVPEYYDNGTVKPNSGVQNVTGTKGGNAACLACHTHTGFESNWKPTAGMSINVSYNDAGQPEVAYNVVGASTVTYTVRS